MAADDLVVGGLTPFTTIDVPGRLSAVVFCQGCPWRCGYCHNPHLASRQTARPVPWSAVRGLLERRQGFLEAVAFSGGEPLLQAAIQDAVIEVKAMGFKAALHTGGMNPRRFGRLLPYLDWIGFDVKTRFDDYARVTGTIGSGEATRESLGLLLAAGTAHEVRTTVDGRLPSRDDLRGMAEDLAALGVKTWTLQECREPSGHGVPAPGPGADILDDTTFVAGLAARFERFQVRRAV